MKKLLTGGIVGAVLALPAVAGAQAIPNATYEGEFTTGLPGTATIVVSEDGTTVDVDFENFGTAAPPCESDVGREGLPISSDSFDLFEPGPSPIVSISGFFGQPGVVTGTAALIFGCDSGNQSWRAETPVVWPDGFLEHGFLGFAGENAYNTTGTDQAIKQTVRQAKVGRFLVHIENDGTEPDGIDVRGCGPSKGFKPTFTQGGDNITSQVRAGTYQTATVDTGESETLKLAIKVSKRAKPGRTKSCLVTMSHSGTFRGISPAFVDAVKPQVKVKRASR